jgi:hypothetical protein
LRRRGQTIPVSDVTDNPQKKADFNRAGGCDRRDVVEVVDRANHGPVDPEAVVRPSGEVVVPFANRIIAFEQKAEVA